MQQSTTSPIIWLCDNLCWISIDFSEPCKIKSTFSQVECDHLKMWEIFILFLSYFQTINNNGMGECWAWLKSKIGWVFSDIGKIISWLASNSIIFFSSRSSIRTDDGDFLLEMVMYSGSILIPQKINWTKSKLMLSFLHF